MRRHFILAAIIAQVVVLAYMVTQREVILATGQRIYLRTAPLDPRDPFRGDFVRLKYAFNTVYPQQMRGTVHEHAADKGYQVYAVMKATPNNLYTLDYLTDEKPLESLFIKGRITRPNWNRGPGAANIKYGLEQLFVEQGQGLEIERTRGTGSGVQIPMEVQVAVGRDGTAVLKEYRWSKLGIQLEMLRINRQTRRSNRPADQNQAPVELSPKVRVTLKNVSDSDLTIADPGDHCGFKLVPVLWASKTYHPMDSSCNSVSSNQQAVIALKPQQSYQAELDLSNPRWHMQMTNSKGLTSEGEIGIDDNPDRFRIVYQSPKLDRNRPSTKPAQPLWLGQLPSRAFDARGRID